MHLFSEFWDSFAGATNRLHTSLPQIADAPRQYSINNYVVDFYCPQMKLAIEIDGDVHAEPSVVLQDQKRQHEIESLGIKVLRYTNGQVNESMEGVLEDILNNLPPTPSFIRRGR